MRARDFLPENRYEDAYRQQWQQFQPDGEEQRAGMVLRWQQVRPNRILVQALSGDGSRELGSVQFHRYDPTSPKWTGEALHVDQRYRRQGVATAMYDWFRQKFGPIRPSDAQTRDGESFWQRKRTWEQGVAEGDKMSRINLDQSLANTPPVWKKFISSLPPQLAREFVDERPRPDQDDIDFLTPLRLVSPQPVSVRVGDLLRHPENQATIGRSPDDVVAAVNQRWGLKIPSGKKYDPNPARYRAYAQMAPGTASPSVMADGVILFGAGRFVAAALRGDETMRVWSMTRKQGVAEGRIINTHLWHGSRNKHEVLEPRQAVDTGGAAGSNQNAIYATSDPKVAIAMGLTTPGSDTGMFPNDPQMVLFSGKIRKGEYVYLHRLPMNGPDGKPQFVQGGNSREFHSVPGVNAIKPIEIKAVPVNKYLNLIRKATREDWALRKKFMKKQGVSEGKIKLSTDPNWYGAEVGDYKASGPIVNIPANRLVGFEPDDKMNQPASKANVQKIVAGLKQGAKLPPLLVRQYKNGYQVLDGHHRFWAYKLLGVKSIPAQVVPAEDIEEITKQGVAEGGRR